MEKIMERRFARHAIVSVAAMLLFSLPCLGENYPVAFPREGAEKALETACVLAWKVTISKGESTGFLEHGTDQLVVALDDGAVKITRPDKTWSIERESAGSVRFDSKGTVYAEEGMSDAPIHFVVFQLKPDAPHAKPMVKSIPGMFPREGSTKLLETDQIIVWDQTWKVGAQGAIHLHYRQGAAVFLTSGTLQGITNGVKGPALERRPGFVFEIRQITEPHLDEAIEGSPHAVFIEFK